MVETYWGPIILGLKEDTKMCPYKNHPIYGIAVPKPGKLWQPPGLVFATHENSTIEI
jgi:hypothetical protein